MAGLPGPTPHGAGRYLNQRHQRPDRLGQGRRRMIRPGPGQQAAQLGERPRLLLGQHPAGLGDRRYVRPGQLAAEGMRQGPVEHRLQQRAQQQAVPGRDQVDSPAHQRDPHHVPAQQQPGQIRRPEPVEPGQQAVVGRERRLGLHPDEVLHHRDHPARAIRPVRAVRPIRGPAQQLLPRQQGTVEPVAAQHLGSHRPPCPLVPSLPAALNCRC
jgi:hypothetical protein